MAFDPFSGGFSCVYELLPSQILGASLAGLRAMKHRFHADDPKTFSREVEWVYPEGTRGVGPGEQKVEATAAEGERPS
jgi:hypothetical protein